MQTMSGLDAGFYLLEDSNTPLHVATVIVAEGPPPSYGDLVRLVSAKLHLIPRYRQRVKSVPLHLSRPVWVDDPHFQILYHVRHTAVPAPGDDEQLRNLAGRVLAQRLDRSKPLWEIWLVQGLRDDRWALIAKVHHCMVDGVAGIDLMTQLFDVTPDAETPAEPAERWRPEPMPSVPALLMHGARSTTAETIGRVGGVPGLLRTLADRETVGAFASGLTRAARRFTHPSASSLNGPIGPHRRWCWQDSSLEEVKAVRRAFGGTINDIVLAAITRGFRDLLEARDELAERSVVRTAVPVSTRTADERGELTNRVAAVLVNLPCGEPDPLHRLRLIREQMDDLKSSHQEHGLGTISRLADTAVAPALLSLAASFPVRLLNPVVQTITTNVPGPPFPLYVLGRKIVGLHPYVPLTGGIRVSIAIFSYLGQLSFGVTGDFDAMPDLEVLTAGIQLGFEELTKLAALTSVADDPDQPAP